MIVVAAVGCKQRYDPPVISSDASYLVVEANLNPNGPDKHITDKVCSVGKK